MESSADKSGAEIVQTSHDLREMGVEFGTQSLSLDCSHSSDISHSHPPVSHTQRGTSSCQSCAE